MGRRKRVQRRFTPEFKRDAVTFLHESGKTVAAVASELGLNRQTLSRWRDELEEEGLDGPGDEETPEQELQRLRKRVRELETEREILKKAAAFFAKESE